MGSLSIPNHAGLVVSSSAGYTRPAWRTCAAVQTPTIQAWRTPAPQGCAWSTLDSYKCSAHLCRPSAPQAPASWGGPAGGSRQGVGAASAQALLQVQQLSSGPLLGRLGLQPDAPSQAPAHLRTLWQHSTRQNERSGARLAPSKAIHHHQLLVAGRAGLTQQAFHTGGRLAVPEADASRPGWWLGWPAGSHGLGPQPGL